MKHSENLQNLSITTIHTNNTTLKEICITLGVFLYPEREAESLIFLGMFQNGKKKGEGIYIDLDMNIYVK